MKHMNDIQTVSESNQLDKVILKQGSAGNNLNKVVLKPGSAERLFEDAVRKTESVENQIKQTPVEVHEGHIASKKA
jgi:hypothetical protein